jgi:hypothetical protein
MFYIIKDLSIQDIELRSKVTLNEKSQFLEILSSDVSMVYFSPTNRVLIGSIIYWIFGK